MNDPSAADAICEMPSCERPKYQNLSYCLTHATALRPKTPAVQPGQHQMVCPHCQVKGRVSTKQVKMKQGISGGKATGAVLTAGFSVLATGLSKKRQVTEAHCGNCGVTWHIA